MDSSKQAKKRNREVENLKTSGFVSSELLAQPVRVTRSQWRRSISERRDQTSSIEADRRYLESSNPSSRDTSRSSSRTASPVFRLAETEKVEDPVVNGEARNCRSSGSQSPEPKRLNSSFLSSERSLSQKEVSRVSSRDTSPETLSSKHKLEKKSNSSGSYLDKGKTRTYRKTTVVASYSFTTEEDQKLSKKIPIVFHSADSKGPSSVTVKEQASNTSNRLASKDIWTSKPVDNTSRFAGKKRVRSFSKAQDPAGKRERKDNSSSIDRSEVKANSIKTDKTGGRLSRARTSQAQTGERRGATGSCASNR